MTGTSNQPREGAQATPPPRRSTRREAMRNVDKAWLDMDTPTNLMIINGVMLFDGVINAERLRHIVEERLVGRYPRFRQRIVESPPGTGRLFWEDDPYFDLRSHLRHVALPAPGDIKTLQRFVSDLISEDMEPKRPLWRFYLIENCEGGSAVFGRLHHCIADGIALVQVLLSLTDNHANADIEAHTPAARRVPMGPGGLLGMVGGAMRSSQRFFSTVTDMALHEGLQSLSNPQHLLQNAYAAGLLSLTSAAIITKLLVIPPDNDSVFKGNLGAHKRVVWSDPVALTDVRALSKAAGATINDVLVAAVAGALRRYMAMHGEIVNIRAMVPVNLRSADHPPETLGNQFALVYLTLPLEEETAEQRLREVKKQMDVLKQSPEPVIVYEILNIIGMFPGKLADWVTSWFSTKASVVLTNVPGPRTRLYFAGQPLKRLMFWVPQSGRIGLGISIISYQGEVLLGVMVDDGLVDEPEEILASFRDEIDEMRRSVGLAPALSASVLGETTPAQP